MCGRFALTAQDIDEAARAFGAEVARECAKLYRVRWNIAPTDSHWIVRLDERGRRFMMPSRFGFLGPNGQPIINHAARPLPFCRRSVAHSRRRAA